MIDKTIAIDKTRKISTPEIKSALQAVIDSAAAVDASLVSLTQAQQAYDFAYATARDAETKLLEVHPFDTNKVYLAGSEGIRVYKPVNAYASVTRISIEEA